MIRGTIIAVTILTALIAILTTVLIGTVFISRPIRFITDVMGRLASGRLSAEVGDLNRKDEIGSMTRAVEVFRRNAIDKEAAEEALGKSENRFREIFEQSPFGIALIGSQTGHLYELNPKFAEIAGRTIEEMKGIADLPRLILT